MAPRGLTADLALAAAVGLVGGLGAYVFRWMIERLECVLWSGEGEVVARILAAPMWLVVALPALGGLAVGLVSRILPPELQANGVPEVMYSVRRRGGFIRPAVALVKAVTSTMTIASGGSAGREGPIVQIGAALASGVVQPFNLSVRQTRLFVGCGAAAGLAATFNAPIAATFFTAELILGGFAVNAFGPLVVSAVVATAVSRALLGDVPAFVIPSYTLVHPAELGIYAALGLISALGGSLFVGTLGLSERRFAVLKAPEWLKPALGGVVVGLLGIGLPQVMGNGYGGTVAALHGELSLGLLVLLFFGKLVSTSLTLGSGGSGGDFAPSLFLGAALGGAVGQLAQYLPFHTAGSGAYAVVGMGALLSAVTHAPIMAMLMIFELTGDYRLILAVMVACVTATLVSQRLSRYSIYSIKLKHRGLDVFAQSEVDLMKHIRVKDIIRRDISLVERRAPLDELMALMSSSPHYDFFVIDEEQRLVGVISVDDLRCLIPVSESLSGVAIAEDLMRAVESPLTESDSLDIAMHRFGGCTYEELPIVSSVDGRPCGVITRVDVINAYNRQILSADLGATFGARMAAARERGTSRRLETLGGFVLVELEAPKVLLGRPLAELRLRSEQGVQVVLVARSSETSRYLFPDASTILEPGDRLLLLGRPEAIERLSL